MDRRRAQAAAGTPALVAAVPDPTPGREASANPPARQRETAEYLADMILELRNLARTVKLYTVMVPLEYAYYEAFGVANRVEIPPADLERIKELSRVGEELDKDPGNAGM